MTKLERTFNVEGEPELEVVIAAGQVIVGESSNGTIGVTVSGSERALETIEIEQLGRSVVVRQRSSGRRMFSRSTDVTVEMPPGGEASIKSATGDVRVAVLLSELQVRVAAGDVRVATVAGTCMIKSASGSVSVDHVGEAQLASASGDIRVVRVDTDVTATTLSGDVFLGSFGKNAVLKTASGDIVAERLDGIELNAQSMSGTIRVGLPPGLDVEAYLQSLSGSIRNELVQGGERPGRHAHLHAKTVSGDIILRSVPAAGVAD